MLRTWRKRRMSETKEYSSQSDLSKFCKNSKQIMKWERDVLFLSDILSFISSSLEVWKCLVSGILRLATVNFYWFSFSVTSNWFILSTSPKGIRSDVDLPNGSRKNCDNAAVFVFVSRNFFSSLKVSYEWTILMIYPPNFKLGPHWTGLPRSCVDEALGT